MWSYNPVYVIITFFHSLSLRNCGFDFLKCLLECAKIANFIAINLVAFNRNFMVLGTKWFI